MHRRMPIGPSVSALLQCRTSLTSKSLVGRVGLQELTSESYDEVMTLNLRSVMESCAAANPHPIETPGQRDRHRIARSADGHHLHLVPRDAHAARRPRDPPRHATDAA